MSRVLLQQSPKAWANKFGGGIRGDRAASFLALALARLMCAEGNHEAEYNLSLAAAKEVQTDEAASYRDAWHGLLTAMEHCYEELPAQEKPHYARAMLEMAREAVDDTDNRFLILGRERPSLIGQLDILVSHLDRCEYLVGVENSQAVKDFKRRERSRSIREESGPTETFSQKHYRGILRTWDENRVVWFRNRYLEKYRIESPADLFVRSEHTRSGIKIKAGYHSLFDKNDHKQFRLDMETLYRKQAGLPAKGEGWVNQTFLLRCVEEIMRGTDVLCEARPSWLQGQRLDIYIPALKIALEYQGEQHYFPLEHLGNAQGLKDRQDMDERKRVACRKAGVTLIEWRYDHAISIESVKAKLREAGAKVEE